MRRPWSALLVAMVAVLGGCDRADDGAPASEPEAAVVDALCAAVRAAGDGDRDGARAAFEDAHGRLHALADEVARKDRRRAAELLRAKQTVEDGLRGAPTEQLGDDLAALARAVADASGARRPRCA